jgi:hypothetical protein
MNNKTFDEFVRGQQENEAYAALVDWGKKRDEWLDHLEHLYSRIESFLGKYVSSGQVRYEYRPVELNEEDIGSYSAKQMVLRIGRQEVDLVPIGTRLVGAKGRVDVSGPAGKIQILLVDGKAPGAADVFFRTKVGVGGRLLAPGESSDEPQIEWEWKILKRPPERRFVALTQETFYDVIVEVTNG